MKLLIGQRFIYSLRVIEYYLRVVADDPQNIESITEESVKTELASRDARILAEMEAQNDIQHAAADGLEDDFAYQPWNVSDQQMLDRLLVPLKGYVGVPVGVVAPRATMTFSSVALGHAMREHAATLNNYLQTFKKKRKICFESFAVGHSAAEAEALTEERMEGTLYHIKDACLITNKLADLVRFVTKDSGFFDGLNLFYYLFYRWHRIDYSHIRTLEAAGVQLPYRDHLMDVLHILEERLLGVDIPDVVALIDEYFEYYARFISDVKVVNALAYHCNVCHQYNSAAETERMLRDLWAVHRAFYEVKEVKGEASPTAGDLSGGGHARSYRRLKDTSKDARKDTRKDTRTVWMCESPRIPDRIPYTHNPTWEGSFTNAFAAAVERRRRTHDVLAGLSDLATPRAAFTPADCEELELLLETTNMTPRDHLHFASNIHHYDAVKDDAAEGGRFVSFNDLNFAPPYYPLIDSTPGAMLGRANFTFEANPTSLIPSLEVGPFKPLLDDLFTELRLKAIRAGYQGISEFKIYFSECKRDDEAAPDDATAVVDDGTVSDSRTETASSGVLRRPSPHYTFKAGKCDYFTCVARKDLFSRFLVPSVGNIRQPLLYLLERGTLPELICLSVAETTQKRYREMANEGAPNVRLSRLFADSPGLEAELTMLLRNKIDEMYTRIVKTSHVLDDAGVLHIKDNGSTYTGCGTFVLTGDRDAEGCDRPLLLLEKRWRVSEENDNLSYPSGGSCDFYVPDDHVPQGEYERLKVLEASPFLTAARELREELNLICLPDDLQLVSFGIDVNRNLQQFSFVLETPQTARYILERKRFAATPCEGLTFFLPFERQAICSVLNNYQMESGAVYSLMRLMELKAHRLWT
jgi:hypothetical protein